jgi:acetyltransferase-like isoleucine patch superfamily enzyme
MQAYLREHLPRHYSVYGDEGRLEIAATAVVNNTLFNLSSGRVWVDDYAFFGHNVCILTGTHDYHRFDEDRQSAVPTTGRDIVIKRGAWIASNATVLGPCIVGEHSVVAACALVCQDVPPYAIVAGNPASVVGTVLE